MSVRGLRLELYTITLLMLAYYIIVRQEGLSANHRLAGLTVWSTAGVLCQINSLAYVLPLLGYAFWRQKLGWKRLIIPIATLLILLLPHLVYNHQKFGDPLWSANIHAIWYRNYEFVELKGSGCEGCPTVEEFRARGHSGAPTTMLHYIFGMHSFSEVVSRVTRGYISLFLYPTQYFWTQVGLEIPVLYYLYLFGLALVLFLRFRELLLFPLLTINMLAFVIPLGIDTRLVAHAVPFVVFPLVYAVYFGAVMMFKAAKKVRHKISSMKL